MAILYAVGDTLVRSSRGGSHGPVNPGQVVTVTSVILAEGESNGIQHAQLRLAEGQGFTFDAKFFDLVRRGSNGEVTVGYKVGDLVQLVKNTAKYQPQFLGQEVMIYKIESTAQPRPYITFQTLDGSRQQAYFDDFVMVKPKVPPKKLGNFREYVLTSATNEVAV